MAIGKKAAAKVNKKVNKTFVKAKASLSPDLPVENKSFKTYLKKTTQANKLGVKDANPTAKSSSALANLDKRVNQSIVAKGGRPEAFYRSKTKGGK
jgi:hypothetical protein